MLLGLVFSLSLFLTLPLSVYLFLSLWLSCSFSINLTHSANAFLCVESSSSLSLADFFLSILPSSLIYLFLSHLLSLTFCFFPFCVISLAVIWITLSVPSSPCLPLLLTSNLMSPTSLTSSPNMILSPFHIMSSPSEERRETWLLRFKNSSHQPFSLHLPFSSGSLFSHLTSPPIFFEFLSNELPENDPPLLPLAAMGEIFKKMHNFINTQEIWGISSKKSKTSSEILWWWSGFVYLLRPNRPVRSTIIIVPFEQEVREVGRK